MCLIQVQGLGLRFQFSLSCDPSAGCGFGCGLGPEGFAQEGGEGHSTETGLAAPANSPSRQSQISEKPIA